MRVLSAHLHDYLSFRDCPPIEFREGINLVVGVNNSGKSALLKALNPTLPAKANRSEERFRDSELPPASVTLRIETSGQRLERAALDIGTVDIPVPAPIHEVYNKPEAKAFLDRLFKAARQEFTVPLHDPGSFDGFGYPAHKLFEPHDNPNESRFFGLPIKKVRWILMDGEEATRMTPFQRFYH